MICRWMRLARGERGSEACPAADTLGGGADWLQEERVRAASLPLPIPAPCHDNTILRGKFLLIDLKLLARL